MTCAYPSTAYYHRFNGTVALLSPAQIQLIHHCFRCNRHIGLQSPYHWRCRLSTFRLSYPRMLLGASYGPVCSFRHAAFNGIGRFIASTFTAPRTRQTWRIHFYMLIYRSVPSEVRQWAANQTAAHSHHEHSTPGILATPLLRLSYK